MKPLALPSPIDKLHGAWRRWFGNAHDLDPIDAVVATAAAERLSGDPLWLLVVGGPGVSKTETVQSLHGAGAIVTSTLSSEAARSQVRRARKRQRMRPGPIATHGGLWAARVERCHQHPCDASGLARRASGGAP